MATFAKLTHTQTGTAFWLNLDHVTEILPAGTGSILRAGAGGIWVAAETPEQIAHLAYAEHPVVAAQR